MDIKNSVKPEGLTTNFNICHLSGRAFIHFVTKTKLYIFKQQAFYKRLSAKTLQENIQAIVSLA